MYRTKVEIKPDGKRAGLITGAATDNPAEALERINKGLKLVNYPTLKKLPNVSFVLYKQDAFRVELSIPNTPFYDMNVEEVNVRTFSKIVMLP